jgi:hypothetical protein
MTRRSNRPARRAGLISFALAALAVGCSKPYDGVSEADRIEMAKQAAVESAKASGLKMTEKTYPRGKAWVVDMKGAAVTDDLVEKLREAGRVAEIDLSNSTVTDAHLALMREKGVSLTFYRVDLSNTAVTDAGLEKLEGLPFLVNLKLTGTRVTQAGVDRFKKARLNNPDVQPQFRQASVTR